MLDETVLRGHIGDDGRFLEELLGVFIVTMDEQVVALLDTGEATLKRFYREPGNKIRLQPANSTMEPRIVEADRCRVQGIVIGVLRSYN